MIEEFIKTLVIEPESECPSRSHLLLFLDECYAYQPCPVELNKIYNELKEKWDEAAIRI